MSTYSKRSHPTARDVPVGTVDPETGLVAAGVLYGWLPLTRYVGIYPTILPRFGENGAGDPPEDFLLLRHQYLCDGEKFTRVAPVGPPSLSYGVVREGYASSNWDVGMTLVDCLSHKDARKLPQGTICPISYFVSSPNGWVACGVYQRRFPTDEPR